MVGPVGDFAPPTTERLEVRPAVDPSEMPAILRRRPRGRVARARRGDADDLGGGDEAPGRPFVSTPVGGIPALAAGGGVLVPVGDEAALADLTELLGDPDLARAIGERGRRFCVQTRSVAIRRSPAGAGLGRVPRFDVTPQRGDSRGAAAGW